MAQTHRVVSGLLDVSQKLYVRVRFRLCCFCRKMCTADGIDPASYTGSSSREYCMSSCESAEVHASSCPNSDTRPSYGTGRPTKVSIGFGDCTDVTDILVNG